MPFDPMNATAGDKVWWNDPSGISSGEYIISRVFADDADEIHGETIVMLRSVGGRSEAEVFMREICAPEDRPRTNWSDVRSWDAAIAASTLAHGSEGRDLPWCTHFDAHLWHDSPIVSLMSNLLTLAHFNGDDIDDVIRKAREAFMDMANKKGEVEHTHIDEQRTEWAHRTLVEYTKYEGGDRLEAMGRFSRLGDLPA